MKDGVPTLWEIFIGTGIIAAATAFFGFIGKLLSDKPIALSVHDTFQGNSTPGAMKAQIDAILATGESALRHDNILATTLSLMVFLVTAASFVLLIRYIKKMRGKNQPVPPKHRTVTVICILALIPIVFAVGVWMKKDSLFHAAPILESFKNVNTSPEVVRPGENVRVTIPVSIQSFFSYYESKQFNIIKSVAYIDDGQQLPVELIAPSMGSGGSVPGKTDFIPVMENLEPKVSFTIPNDPQFDGAIIEFICSGTLETISSNRNFVDQDYNATTSFRLARAKEMEFANSYNAACIKITQHNDLAFYNALLVFLGIIFLTPGMCSRCENKYKRIVLLNRDDYVCPTCFKEIEKERASSTKV